MIYGGRILVQVEGRDIGLSQLLQTLQTQLRSTVTSANQFDGTMQQLSATQRTAENALASYASAAARAAVSVKDYAQAQAVLGTAIQNLTPGTTNAINLFTQLQNTISQGEAAAAKARQPFTDLVQGLQGLAIGGRAISAFASQIGDFIDIGNQAEKVDATFRALSGSQAKYDENLRIAHEQQAKFGGSLQETEEGLSGFLNLSNRTGIAVDKLAQTARGLAVIDPAQGFKGAAIAMKEFFSGDINSLARRFELPKKALNDIKNLAPEEAFIKLNEVLRENGVTMELINAQSQTVAVNFDKLKGSVTDLGVTLSQLTGKALAPLARVFAEDFRQINEDIKPLLTAGDQITALTPKLIASSQGFADYNSKIGQFNQQFGVTANLMGIQFQQLTQEQFAFAQGMIAGGANAQQLSTALANTNEVAGLLSRTYAQNSTFANAGADAQARFGQAALQAAQYGKEGQAVVEGETFAVIDHNLTIGQAVIQLEAFIAAKQAQAAQEAATTEAINATSQAVNLLTGYTEEETVALTEEIAKKQASEQAGQALSMIQATLANLGGAVASGLITSGNAAAQMAAQYSIASSEAERLINLQAQLASMAPGFAGPKGSFGFANFSTGSAGAKAVWDQFKKTGSEAKKALEDEKLAVGTAAEKRQVYNDRLAKTGKLFGTNSADYIRARTELERFDQSQDKSAKKGASRAKKGGGGGGGAAKDPTQLGKVNAAEKADNAIQSLEEKADNKLEDTIRAHLQKVNDIYKEFNDKLIKAQKEAEVSKRRSRFSFYASLTDLPKGLDAGKFSAQYEQAFTQAQEFAKNGRVSLSKEFLKLKQDQINEMKDLESKRQEIVNDKDLTKDQRSKQVAYYDGLIKLARDAQNEEEKQLLEGGDALQNELKDRLSEEDAAYADQLSKIETNAQRQADAKVAAAERGKVAVTAETKALADQVGTLANIKDLTDQIAAQVGGPAINAGIPQTAGNRDVTPITAVAPLPVNATTSLPVTAPTALPVTQQTFWTVRDEGVIGAIGDMSARLEGKLDAVTGAVNDTKAALSGKLDSVAGAVRNIRITNIVSS